MARGEKRAERLEIRDARDGQEAVDEGERGGHAAGERLVAVGAPASGLSQTSSWQWRARRAVSAAMSPGLP